MLKIRQEQLEVLSQYTNRQFEEKIMNFLQHHFDGARRKSREEELRPVVQEQIANARFYELVTERQILTYVVTAWLMGRKFNVEFLDAEKILKSSQYSPDEKTDLLSQWSEKKLADPKYEERD